MLPDYLFIIYTDNININLYSINIGIIINLFLLNRIQLSKIIWISENAWNLRVIIARLQHVVFLIWSLYQIIITCLLIPIRISIHNIYNIFLIKSLSFLNDYILRVMIVQLDDLILDFKRLRRSIYTVYGMIVFYWLLVRTKLVAAVQWETLLVHIFFNIYYLFPFKLLFFTIFVNFRAFTLSLCV